MLFDENFSFVKQHAVLGKKYFRQTAWCKTLRAYIMCLQQPAGGSRKCRGVAEE
jgi:hypothetical protein